MLKRRILNSDPQGTLFLKCRNLFLRANANVKSEVAIVRMLTMSK